MKFTTSYIKYARGTRNTIVLFILTIVFGVIAFIMSKNVSLNTASVTGVIVEIKTEGTDSHNAYVDYTVDGVKYEHVLYPTWEESMRKGQTIEVVYDISDPSKPIANDWLLLCIFAGLSGLFLVITIVTLIRNSKSKKIEKDVEKQYGKFDDRTDYSGVIYEDKYLTQFNANYPQGYVLCDQDRNEVIVAQSLSGGLFKPTEVEFRNKLTGKVDVYKMTNPSYIDNGTIAAKTMFKVDGENVWDFIHRKGIRIKSEITDITKNEYTIVLNNSPVARVKTATVGETQEGQYPKFIQNVGANGFYHVEMNEANVDIVFLVIYLMAKSGQRIFD